MHALPTHIFSLIKVCTVRCALLDMLAPRHELLKRELKRVSLDEKEIFCPTFQPRSSPTMPHPQQPTQLKKLEEITLYLAQVELALANEVAKRTLMKK